MELAGALSAPRSPLPSTLVSVGFLEVQRMVCSSCGAWIEDVLQPYCDSCGAVLDADPPDEPR